MLDDPDTITKKIKRAQTDSDSAVRYDKAEKPAVSNLMTIYSLCSGKSLEEIASMYEGKGYGAFKSDLAEVVVETLRPIQDRYNQLIQTSELDDILTKGAEKASETANKVLHRVEKAMGMARLG